MTTTAFTPVGEVARWRLVYQLMQRADVGDTITYKSMAKVLDLNSETDRDTIRAAVHRAAREYERNEKRAIDAVPNVGYRVVAPAEHLTLARRHQRKSYKALRRSHSKAVNVDVTGMPMEMRKGFEVVARALAMQMEFNRRTDIRQKRLEEAVESMGERSDKTEAELQELRARLEKLEAS